MVLKKKYSKKKRNKKYLINNLLKYNSMIKKIDFFFIINQKLIKNKDNLDTSNQVNLLMSIKCSFSPNIPEIPDSLLKLSEIPDYFWNLSIREQRKYLYEKHGIILKDGIWQKAPDTWITRHEEFKLQKIELEKLKIRAAKFRNEMREKERKMELREKERLEKQPSPEEIIKYRIEHLVAISIQRVKFKLLEEYNDIYQETKLSVNDALKCNIPNWKEILELRIQHLNNDLKSSLETMNRSWDNYFECGDEDDYGDIDVIKTDNFRYWLNSIQDTRKELIEISSVLITHLNKHIE